MRSPGDALAKFIESSALRWSSDYRYRQALTREAKPQAAEQLKRMRQRRAA